MKLNFKRVLIIALIIGFVFSSSKSIFAAGNSDLYCTGTRVTYSDVGEDSCINTRAALSWSFTFAHPDGSPYNGEIMVRTSGVMYGLVGGQRLFNTNSTGVITGNDQVIDGGSGSSQYLGTSIIYHLYEDGKIGKEIDLCRFTLPNNICEEAKVEMIECWQAQGDTCISVGEFDVCDENYGRYTGFDECVAEIPQGLEAGKDVTKAVLDSLNPLIQMQALDSDPGLAEQLSTPGGIISRFLGVFAFPIAGLILFVMLIWGGIEMMASSATSKSVDAGKQRVTTALLGFLLLFASFWIARILEMMFGIKIL